MAEEKPLSFEQNHKQVRDTTSGNIIAVPCEVNDENSIANQRKKVQTMGDKIINALDRDRVEQQQALEIKEVEKTRILEKAKLMGVEIPADRLDKVEDLQYFSKLLKTINDERSERAHVSPAGTVPLAGNLQSGHSEGYDSYEEMIQDVHRKAHSDDPAEAKEYSAIEKEFWIRFTSSIKSNHPFPIDIEVNPKGTKLMDLVNESNQELQKTKRRLMEKRGS